MTLLESSTQSLRQQGFTAADIRAIFAIMEAMPYCQIISIREIDCNSVSAVVVEKFLNQVSAIARLYQTHFKNAADRKEIYPR